jgi:hypothetical protein
VAELRQRGKCVVVHCRSGQVRSAALIASILVMAGGLTLDEAEGVLAEHRHIKGGSIPQLRSFDKWAWLQELVPNSFVEPRAAPASAASASAAPASAASASAASASAASAAAASASVAPTADPWAQVTSLTQQLTEAVSQAMSGQMPADARALQARLQQGAGRGG